MICPVTAADRLAAADALAEREARRPTRLAAYIAALPAARAAAAQIAAGADPAAYWLPGTKALPAAVLAELCEMADSGAYLAALRAR